VGSDSDIDDSDNGSEEEKIDETFHSVYTQLRYYCKHKLLIVIYV